MKMESPFSFMPHGVDLRLVSSLTDLSNSGSVLGGSVPLSSLLLPLCVLLVGSILSLIWMVLPETFVVTSLISIWFLDLFALAPWFLWWSLWFSSRFNLVLLSFEIGFIWLKNCLAPCFYV